ncbi:MAG: PadR family transcriptional regulator [Arachnia sp.]
MRPMRLFLLGALAEGGPQHGYQIRQDALRDRVDMWTSITPGSLYSALHRMVDDGLIAVDRTETPAASPQRTIYRITSSGRDELIAQRDEALARVVVATDPLDLALRFVSDLSVEELTGSIRSRHAELVERLALHEEAYSSSQQHLTGWEPITFRHVLQRLRAEVDWHDQLLAELASVSTPRGLPTPGPFTVASHT